MGDLGTITREQIAAELSQGRTDGHNYFYLLITTSHPSNNYPRIVETALVQHNNGDWRKVEDCPNVRLYFGHFPSRAAAASNRLRIREYINGQAENSSPHLILSEAFNYLPEYMEQLEN
ncbi:unnamed protein product [Rhizophagus irregularis]|nr:unnamed protein product [Rhizophagus irregularis]CAB4411299.1 unnamed protein product [Rhizophagus irregularis]